MTVRFRRPRSPARWVGLLTSVAGLAAPPTSALKRERGFSDETWIATSIIADESVSRRHARITRVLDEFVIEDLNSYNGTHVDGTPIISCVLHDGDTVQIGQTMYYFERSGASPSSHRLTFAASLFLVLRKRRSRSPGGRKGLLAWLAQAIYPRPLGLGCLAILNSVAFRGTSVKSRMPFAASSDRTPPTLRTLPCRSNSPAPVARH